MSLLQGIIVLLVAVIIVLVILLIFGRRRRAEVAPLMDDLEGHEFEFYCAELLKRSGFHEVEVTKGSGDFGADILAQKDGVTYAIQCKCYTSPIGVFAIQQAYAGKAYYDCMVGAVMTNQYFTGPAMMCARKLNVLLWDRGYLEQFESSQDE